MVDPSPSAHEPADDLETLFLRHLPTIDRIIGVLALRYTLQPADRDDFASWTHMKLVDADYAIFRKHKGLSSLDTYLAVVVANLFRDWRIAMWGRWRPSAASKRVGPTGVALERLMVRDGMPRAEALRVLESRGQSDVPQTELVRLATTFRPRHTGPVELGEVVENRVPSAIQADQPILHSEGRREADSLKTALEEEIAGLDPEDRVVLKLRFEQGLSVAQVSRATGLEQRPLYRRLERVLKGLRESLTSRGVDGSSVRELIDGGYG